MASTTEAETHQAQRYPAERSGPKGLHQSLHPGQPAKQGGLGAVARLIRVENSVLAALLAFVGAASTGAIAASDGWWRILIAGLVVALVVAAGNAVNDLCDHELDAGAGLSRPLVTGELQPQDALIVTLVSSVFAVSVAVVLGAPTAAFVSVMVLLAIAYSVRLKRVPMIGNLSVASQCSATVLFGAAAVGAPTPTTWRLALVVLLGMTAFEVAKTISDEVTDWDGGVRTIAHRLGNRSQRALVGILSAAAFAAGALHANGFLQAGLLCAPVVALGLSASWAAKRPLHAVVRPFVGASKLLWVLSLLGMLLAL